MADEPDVFIEYTYTNKTSGQVHRAVAKIRGAKIAEHREREKDQKTPSFDIAHSLSESLAWEAMAASLPDVSYASYELKHFLLTSLPPSIESHQPIRKNQTVTVWAVSAGD